LVSNYVGPASTASLRHHPPEHSGEDALDVGQDGPMSIPAADVSAPDRERLAYYRRLWNES
jgi:hypothetical protein